MNVENLTPKGPCAGRSPAQPCGAMRSLLLLASFALLGCGGSDDAVFLTASASTTSSSTSVSTSTSTTSTTGTGGMGGAGGGSTVASTSSAGGMGGTGQGGDGGQGGDCVPDPNPCDTMPDGLCGGWTNSCGGAIECGNEACSGLSCDLLIPGCVCNDASGYGVAVNKCNTAGPGLSPWLCGDDPLNPDVPAGCAKTDLQVASGDAVWCCPN